jgi:SAM-dependent methyltransferase
LHNQCLSILAVLLSHSSTHKHRQASPRLTCPHSHLLACTTLPCRWVQGDALQLPFEAAEFDAATMGYGLRNVADIRKALSELHRVLKPGGSAAVLDFNNSSDPLVDNAQVRAGA